MICYVLTYTNKYGMHCHARYYSDTAVEAEADRLRNDKQLCASDVQVTITTDLEYQRQMALRQA